MVVQHGKHPVHYNMIYLAYSDVDAEDSVDDGKEQVVDEVSQRRSDSGCVEAFAVGLFLRYGLLLRRRREVGSE